MAKIDIVNQSLTALGLDKIDSLDDSTQEADYALMYFDNALGELLESYSWSFMIKVSKLNQVELDEKYNYRYAFQMPSDCSVIREAFVGQNASISPTVIFGSDIFLYNQYTVKGDLIYTNVNNIFLEYYSNFLTEGSLQTLSVKFKNAISSKLAVILASKFNPAMLPVVSDNYKRDLYAIKNFDSRNKQTHGFDNANSFYLKLIRV